MLEAARLAAAYAADKTREAAPTANNDLSCTK
jgi:hypothetical protein